MSTLFSTNPPAGILPNSNPPAAPSPTPAPAALDPQAVNLAKAIRQQESGGDFRRSGKSGEYGAYQFEPTTWAAAAPKYGVNVPLNQATPEQQNQVAYGKIKELKDKGLNVGQIASSWNAGEGEPNAYTGNFSNGRPAVGVNKYGVNYDVPGYAKAVATYYQKFKAENPQTPPPATPPAGTDPNAGAPAGQSPLLSFAEGLNNTSINNPTSTPSANGGQGTAVGNFLGGLEGLAPGQGTLAGNILRAPEALAMGVAKEPFKVAGNLAQFAGGLFGAGPNSALNQESPAGQEFAGALRGQNFLEKTGTTAADVAGIVADPGSVLGKAGQFGENLASTLLPFGAEGSKLAKAIALGGRGAAEGAVLGPILQGHAPTVGETIGNALLPNVLSPVLKGLGNLIFPKLGSKAADDALASLEANISKTHAPGDAGYSAQAGADPEVIARATAQKKAFNSGMQKYFDNAGVNFKKGLNFANQKFANLAQREADATGTAPKKNTLLDYIFDTGGGIDGIDNNGRPITAVAQKAQQGIIDEISPLLNRLYRSSGEEIDGAAIGRNALKDAATGKYGLGDPTRQAKDAIERQIGSIDALHDPNATPADLYKVSQDLRNQAYEHTETFKRNQTPIDSITAQVKRDLAAKIDEELSKIKDVPPNITARIKNMQTRAYTARDFLQHMETLRAPDNFTKTVGKAIGGAAGWSAAGWPGAIVGAGAGARVVSRLRQAFGDLNLTSDVMQKFGARATADQVRELQDLAQKIVTENEAKTSAEASLKARALPAGKLQKSGSFSRLATPEEVRAKQLVEQVLGNKLLPGPVGTPEEIAAKTAANPRYVIPSGPAMPMNPAGKTIEPTGRGTLAGRYTPAAGPVSTRAIPKSKLNAIQLQHAESEPYLPPSKLPRIKY